VGEALTTFTILTTTPNELMAPIHDRMPVIVAPRNYERWLDTDEKVASTIDLLALSCRRNGGLDGERPRGQSAEQRP
jgi:putative SOS response-associated peptidase YedK